MPSLIEQNIVPCVSAIKTETGDGDSLRITASCTFPESFSGFQGHFPDKPVLPAIIQLAVVRYLVEQTVQFPLTVVQYTRAKFKAMVAPEEQLLVAIHLDASEETFTGKFKITKEESRQVASGNFVFKNKLQNS